MKNRGRLVANLPAQRINSSCSLGVFELARIPILALTNVDSIIVQRLRYCGQ